MVSFRLFACVDVVLLCFGATEKLTFALKQKLKAACYKLISYDSMILNNWRVAHLSKLPDENEIHRNCFVYITNGHGADQKNKPKPEQFKENISEPTHTKGKLFSSNLKWYYRWNIFIRKAILGSLHSLYPVWKWSAECSMEGMVFYSQTLKKWLLLPEA